MQEIRHRGYLIRAHSYQKSNGKWAPKAEILSLDESQVQIAPPLEWQNEFENQTQADDYALEGAQFYIDNEEF